SSAVEGKSLIPIHSATALPTTLAATTLVQRIILTATVLASRTHTPTATSTPTSFDPVTTRAIVGTNDKANASASFTYTPTRNFPPTATLTATLRPVFPNTPTALPGAVRVDAEGVVLLWTPAGCFTMGSNPVRDKAAGSDEQPPHEVCLTHSFWTD